MQRRPVKGLVAFMIKKERFARKERQTLFWRFMKCMPFIKIEFEARKRYISDAICVKGQRYVQLLKRELEVTKNTLRGNVNYILGVEMRRPSDEPRILRCSEFKSEKRTDTGIAPVLDFSEVDTMRQLQDHTQNKLQPRMYSAPSRRLFPHEFMNLGNGKQLSSLHKLKIEKSVSIFYGTSLYRSKLIFPSNLTQHQTPVIVSIQEKQEAVLYSFSLAKCYRYTLLSVFALILLVPFCNK